MAFVGVTMAEFVASSFKLDMWGSRIVLPDMSQKMLAFSPPRSGHGTTSAVRMSLMKIRLVPTLADPHCPGEIVRLLFVVRSRKSNQDG